MSGIEWSGDQVDGWLGRAVNASYVISYDDHSWRFQNRTAGWFEVRKLQIPVRNLDTELKKYRTARRLSGATGLPIRVGHKTVGARCESLDEAMAIAERDMARAQ
jgi:hypothetical protein